jgi:hypothetical protein
MAHGALTPIIGLRLLALAAGLRHNAEIGQPGLCFSAYSHNSQSTIWLSYARRRCRLTRPHYSSKPDQRDASIGNEIGAFFRCLFQKLFHT